MGDHHTSNSHDQLRKICAGALTGISERVVSHPIETCKVVLQATPASTSAMQALSSRLSQQGFFSFYRGSQLAYLMRLGAAALFSCEVLLSALLLLLCTCVNDQA